MNTLISTNDSPLQETGASASTSPRNFARKGRILIVDDDEDTRFLHSRLLSGAGYDTDEAADGEEAWMMIFTTSYELILTDYNMPRLNGLELVARMRAAGMMVPVIVVSAALDLGHASEHPSLHLNAIVQKSFQCRNILDAVMRVLPPKAGLFRGHPAPTHLVLTQLN